MREHGTHACYVWGPNGGPGEGCRCQPCRDSNTAYEQERARRIAPPYVTAGPARDHCTWLGTQGVGLKQVARASGVSHGALSKLMYGTPTLRRPPSKRIRPATAEAILAVTPSNAAPGSRVPAGPVLAQVARLVAAGVPRVRIAERIGQSGPGLQLGNEVITRKHADAIATMAAELDAGALVTIRRTRWGDTTIAPPATDPDDLPPPSDDFDLLLLEMVEMLEERIDQPWRAQAACRDRPPWIWFPARGDGETRAAAVKICGSCFVRDECLQANLHKREGIYGGLSPKQRRALVKEPTAA